MQEKHSKIFMKCNFFFGTVEFFSGVPGFVSRHVGIKSKIIKEEFMRRAVCMYLQ